MTPTARSLKKLRDEGWHAYVVERWIPRARVRKDVAGFMDILAWKMGETLAVQATTGSNVSAREDKILNGGLTAVDFEAFLAWKGYGEHGYTCFPPRRRVEIHGWAKQGPRGKRKLWTCRVVEI